MAKTKLTKTVLDAATPRAKEYELRDTVAPGFLLKVTPAGRKIFMVQYRTNTVSAGSQQLAGSANSQSSKRAPLPKTGLPTFARARIRAPKKGPHATLLA
jgi:hypothetical protein